MIMKLQNMMSGLFKDFSRFDHSIFTQCNNFSKIIGAY